MQLLGRFVLAGILAVCCAVVRGQETGVPVGLCARVERPPTVDGRLDDAAWKQCEVFTPFVKLDGTGPATQQTAVRACFDGSSLFLGCELLESEMGALKAEATPADSGKLFSNDCVEIFVQPDAATGEYFHLVASAAGSTYDAIATGGPVDWTPKWFVQVSKGADRWFLEVAIPLGQIGLGQVREGQTVRLNVCREEKPHDELSCWSCTRGTFHNATLFGEVVFASFAPLVKARLAELDDKLGAARVVAEGSRALERATQKFAGARKLALKQPFGSGDWRELRPQLAALSKEFDRLALGAREAFLWRLDPWRLPAHTTFPEVGTLETEDVTVRLMRGEYESVALGICNSGETSLAYHVTVTDLLAWHENEEIPLGGRITLREAVPMRTRSGGMLRDALPRLTQAQRLVVPAGENAVLWVTVHARDLEPGSYLAGIGLLPMVGVQRRTVRLTLEVVPVDMPKAGPPYVHNWAYLTRAAERAWAEAASRDLAEHYLNVSMLKSSEVPWPTVDAEGNLKQPLDFGELDAFIDLLPEGSFYLLNLSLHWFEDLRTKLKPWTPEHRNALRQWALAIRDHLRDRGIGYDRWAWYPKDEPSTDKYALLVRRFADAVHEADPEMMVYANPFNRTTPEQIRVMGEAIDIWCPNLSGLRPDDLAYMKQHGKRLWSYLVLSRLSNPYGAYRLPFWRAYDMGMTGFGYWAYDSVDGDVWDDSDGRVSDYAVYYEAADGPIPSVRWEATREGAEDFRYLRILRAAAKDARGRGQAQQAEAIDRAVDGAVTSVLGAAGTPATADQQRLALLDVLVDALADAGRIEKGALEAMERPVPACLTGNGGPRVRNIDTGGHYMYSVFPTHTWKEQCGVGEGRVWFRGHDATAGPQQENGIGGDLTDGSWFYRNQYVNLWVWGPNKTEITFDLTTLFRLARVDVFAGGQTNETNRVQSLAVLISQTGAEESFVPCGEITDCPGAKLGPQGEFQFVTDARARYVRIVPRKKVQTMTVGEVRIWGFSGEHE